MKRPSEKSKAARVCNLGEVLRMQNEFGIWALLQNQCLRHTFDCRTILLKFGGIRARISSTQAEVVSEGFFRDETTDYLIIHCCAEPHTTSVRVIRRGPWEFNVHTALSVNCFLEPFRQHCVLIFASLMDGLANFAHECEIERVA